MSAPFPNPNVGRGFQRAPVPQDFWKRYAQPITIGWESFQVWWAPPAQDAVNVTDYVESLTWDDAGAPNFLTAQMTFRDPWIGTVPALALGDQFLLKFSQTGSEPFSELWRLRVNQPDQDFSARQRTFALQSDLWILGASNDDFHFSHDKDHPKGWTADEITIEVLKRYRLPAGQIAKGTHLFRRFSRVNTTDAGPFSPLSVIQAVYVKERRNTKRRFVISCYHGKINITELQRSNELLLLGDELIEATLSQAYRPDFATALSVRALATQVAQPSKSGYQLAQRFKVHVEVESAAAIEKFGYVHKVVFAHDALSEHDAIQRGQYHLSQVGLPQKTLNLTQPGIAMVKRGDAVRVQLDDPATDQVVFVTDAAHSLTAGSYTVAMQFAFTDPFVDQKTDTVNESLAIIKSKANRTGLTVLPKVDENRVPQSTVGQDLSRQLG